jgi:hypothetical protein
MTGKIISWWKIWSTKKLQKFLVNLNKLNSGGGINTGEVGFSSQVDGVKDLEKIVEEKVTKVYEKGRIRTKRFYDSFNKGLYRITRIFNQYS